MLNVCLEEREETYRGDGLGAVNFSTAESHAVLESRRMIAAAVFAT